MLRPALLTLNSLSVEADEDFVLKDISEFLFQAQLNTFKITFDAYNSVTVKGLSKLEKGFKEASKNLESLTICIDLEEKCNIILYTLNRLLRHLDLKVLNLEMSSNDGMEHEDARNKAIADFTKILEKNINLRELRINFWNLKLSQKQTLTLLNTVGTLPKLASAFIGTSYESEVEEDVILDIVDTWKVRDFQVHMGQMKIFRGRNGPFMDD